ncbi:hydrophobin 2 [Phlebopus sp. FC_14]|nr:hydrophobin 2 [Phlebopus sp. FC_14]
MFPRLATILVPAFALAAVAAAAPSPIEARDGECNTGSLQCCTSTFSASDPTSSALLGLLGIVLGPIDGLLGLGCTPITVIGTGSGATCTQQPVCCTGNTYNGLINIGCSPINLNV